MRELVGCYRWKRPPGVEDFWSIYPGAAEQYESHEVTTLFWRVVQ